jgi:aryl-phospho-beta-D-glucosidase BglC (GH1 family)
MKKFILLWTLILVHCFVSMLMFGQNYLSVQGNKLIDSEGKVVRLTGVNWFGFETSNLHVHGIWSRDTKSMLQQIKDQGFNVVRIPWCNKILEESATLQIDAYGTDPYTGVSPMNEYESTLTKPVELLDVIVEWCQENDMKVILDNHSRQPDGYMNELLWYTDKTPESKWIEDWVFLAERYKEYDAVIGMDLNNEPHGKYGNGATWGDSSPDTDWNMAAERCGNAILAVNPNVLILVEGIESYQGETYWWGGNLKGVNDYPVQLDYPNKLLYSPHEYGPTVYNQSWFSASDFPDNMPAIWEENFNFIHTKGISPLLIGEFGIRDQEGVDEIWFDALMEYMGQKGYSWTFWCWNPNSGDTGGLLDDQWSEIVEWKMEKLRPYLAPVIPNGEASSGSGEVAPVAVVEVSETDGVDSLTVSFDASKSYDPNDDELTYSWDFGDGSSAEGVVAVHKYYAGTYTAKITVSDGENSNTASVFIDVISSTELPCESPVPISLPYSNDGIGEFCLVTSEEISFVNSWNMSLLEINGVDYTDTWSNSMPEKIQDRYYIRCSGLYSYSHFELAGTKSIAALQNSSKKHYTAYPNPFVEQFILEIENFESLQSIEILNSTGVRIEYFSSSEVSPVMILGLDYQQGIYLLRLNYQDRKETTLLSKLN